MAILQKKIETNDREIGFSKYGLSNINVGNLRRKKTPVNPSLKKSSIPVFFEAEKIQLITK